MEASLTLRQAGNQLGVEDTTLSRLIRVGGLPEAMKVNTPQGVMWMIPETDLAAIAGRNGWTIDLRDGAPSPVVIEPTAPVHPTSAEAPLPAGVPLAERPPTPIGQPADSDDADQTAQTVEAESTSEPTDGRDLVIRADHAPAAPPAPGREDAIEARVAEALPVADGEAATGLPTVAEALDLELLERLLEAQEGRVGAEVQARESKNALAALNISHNRTTAELEVERRERMVTADRYREERQARAVSDAKVAELRDRILREMALAEAEKQARAEAMARGARAERDTANALASMGWRARRRYRKLSARRDDAG